MNRIEKITSRDNRRLVSVRKVRDGKTGDKIFIEGKRLAAESLRSDIEIEECFPRELEEKIAAGHGFKSITHKLEFFGVCPACQG